MKQKITFKIDTTEKISVEDFSNSLIAFNNEFKRYSSNSQELFISEIRKGSYIVDFVTNIVLPTLFVASQTNIAFEFIEHLGNLRDKIIGKSNLETCPVQSYENTSKIIQPIINCGNHCQITLIAGNQEVNISTSEAKQIKANLLKLALPQIKAIIQENSQSTYTKVLFYWYQVGFDKNNANKGNKGLIDTIQKEPVGVIFEDDNSLTKREMTTSQDNVDWQERGYIVDVEVMKKEDKIVKYKILNNYMNDSVIDNLIKWE